MSQIYRHYGDSQFRPELMINRPSCDFDMSRIKPSHGLWASPVDSNCSWKDFCESENFRVNTLENYFDFTLSDSARTLEIKSKADLLFLLNNYPEKKLEDFEIPMFMNMYDRWNETCVVTCYPDYNKVYEDYDAMEVRISTCPQLLRWMNTWDCDSLVVFNSEVVQVI